MASYRAVPLAVLIPQIFLGIAWTRSAIGHIVESDWWTGQQILDFVAECEEFGLPFYSFLAELILKPLATQFAVVVVIAQAALGVLLLANVRPRITTLASIFLSMNFIMGGQVNPSVFYIILALVVLFRAIDARPARQSWKSFSLQSLVLLGLVLLLCGPFVRTLNPVHVIDDPAVVLISVVATFTASSWIVYLRLLWFPQAASSGMLSESSFDGHEAGANLAHELKSIALQVDALAERLTDAEPETELTAGAESESEHLEVEEPEVDEPVAEEPEQLELQAEADLETDSELDEHEAEGDPVLEEVVVESEDESVEVERAEADASYGDLPDEDLPDRDLVGEVGAHDGLVIVDREIAESNWFSVRCHFQLSTDTYEERITIWQSGEFEDALEMAEQEARNYAASRGGRYLESCDGYRMSNQALMAEPGQQLYSLVRTSSLAPAAYLRQFFFTGAEQSLYA